jgi:ApeA N-terminal domain 1
VTKPFNEWSEWWVAGASEHRTTGEIAFDEASGATLTLYGLLPGMGHVQFRSPLLHGETFDGEPLTLPPAALLHRGSHVGGGIARTRTRLRSGVLLRGCHVDLDELRVKRAVISMTGLRDVCLRPWPYEDGGFMGAARRVQVAGGSLTFRQSTQTESGQYTESTERDVDVLVEVDEPLLLADFEDRWVDPLEALILFAARTPVARKGFTLLLYDPDAATSVHPAIRHGTSPDFWNETPAEVLTETPSLSSEPPTEYGRLLVPFNALGDGAEEFIGRWWELYAQLSAAAVFLMSALGSQLYLENRLLNLMSFIESYHRQLHDKPKVPPELHQENVNAMLEVIEGNAQKAHYKQKLKFAGEQNARQRVKALVRRAHQTLPGVDRLDAKLADQLVDTRNALTHLDPSGDPGLRGVDLVYAVARLQLVIQTNLLLDLQLAKTKVTELVLTSYSDQMPVRDFSQE